MQKQTQLGIAFLVLIMSILSIVSAVSIKDVSSSPREVAPGQTVEIVIEVENIFEYDVFNLNVKIDLSGEDIPFAPYQSSSEKFLDELKEGNEEDFKFKLIALPETASGIYKIPVEITYEDVDGNLSAKEELVSLTVNAKPELKVSLDDSVILIRGRENTFSIRVINSGLSDVRFVYVNVNSVVGIDLLSENEQYMGDINSDDFDSVAYDVYIKESAPGTINLPVVLEFRDATNKEFAENSIVIIKTYSLKQAQNLGLVKKPNYTLYIAMGVIVLIYLIYKILKKRKRRKGRG